MVLALLLPEVLELVDGLVAVGFAALGLEIGTFLAQVLELGDLGEHGLMWEASEEGGLGRFQGRRCHRSRQAGA